MPRREGAPAALGEARVAARSPRCTCDAHPAAPLPPRLRMGAVHGFGLRGPALPQPDGHHHHAADG